MALKLKLPQRTVAGETKKGESLLQDSPFRVVMRFVLHLLAALLLIEEDAGRHEDGTADDERLADESLLCPFWQLLAVAMGYLDP